MSKPRIVIIGLDGVPYNMIKDFGDSGVMPNIANVARNGTFGQMFSTIPEISSVAWSSMITGKNPAEHGIFGFTSMAPGSYRLTFPNFTQLKAKPFWEEWSGQSVIINVPSTYPVRPMRGAHIAGFVAVDFDKSVYPASLASQLQGLHYRLDVDSQKAHQSMDLFLEDMEQTLAARIKAYQMLWERIDWDTFMLVFTSTDRLMHFLYDAYEEPTHKHNTAFLDHFRKIDETVGEILNRLRPEDIILFLSDHGFERLTHEVHLNYILHEEGFLRYVPGTEPNWENIDFGTTAFAMDPSRIYINYEGKYPCGRIKPEDAPALLDRLESVFSNLEIEGRKVVRDIYHKEHVFRGQYFSDAPDMVLVANTGFDFKAKCKATSLCNKGLFSGKHTQNSAFILINKPEQKLPLDFSVADVRGLLENMRAR